MVVLRNADYDYDSYNVSEANRYVKWYDWNTVQKHSRILNIVIPALVAVSAFMLRQKMRDMLDVTSWIFLIIVGTVFFFGVITPIHEYYTYCLFQNACLTTNVL